MYVIYWLIVHLSGSNKKMITLFLMKNYNIMNHYTHIFHLREWQMCSIIDMKLFKFNIILHKWNYIFRKILIVTSDLISYQSSNWKNDEKVFLSRLYMILKLIGKKAVLLIVVTLSRHLIHYQIAITCGGLNIMFIKN